MKSLVLCLLAGLTFFSAEQTVTTEDSGNQTITEPFEFHTDDGCGPYHVSGTVTIRWNSNSTELLSYEGTAVNVITGEETPLHVRTVGSDGPNGFRYVINGVFPGVMQFHYQLNIKFDPQFTMHVNDFSHCVTKGNSSGSN